MLLTLNVTSALKIGSTHGAGTKCVPVYPVSFSAGFLALVTVASWGWVGLLAVFLVLFAVLAAPVWGFICARFLALKSRTIRATYARVSMYGGTPWYCSTRWGPALYAARALIGSS